MLALALQLPRGEISDTGWLEYRLSSLTATSIVHTEESHFTCILVKDLLYKTNVQQLNEFVNRENTATNTWIDWATD